MKITNKELTAFHKILNDTFAPSANDAYNVATYGMEATRFYELKRHIESKYGMRCFWPSKLTLKSFE